MGPIELEAAMEPGVGPPAGPPGAAGAAAGGGAGAVLGFGPAVDGPLNMGDLMEQLKALRDENKAKKDPTPKDKKKKEKKEKKAAKSSKSRKHRKRSRASSDSSRSRSSSSLRQLGHRRRVGAHVSGRARRRCGETATPRTRRPKRLRI